MTQGELEKLAIPMGRIFSDLEQQIMADIVRRIKINGFSTATADWEMTRLQQLGTSEKEIRKWVQAALQASEEELERIYSDEVYRQYTGFQRAYRVKGFEQIPFEDNIPLQQLIEAVKKQVSGEYRSMTGSMGFAIRGLDGKIMQTPLMDFYRETLDDSVAGIHSGVFSYQAVLEKDVNQMTASGVRWIDYSSGVHNRVDVAARRAVLTGFRQIQGQINQQVAADLGTDFYEVSYHVGARPTHQPWQGRVWSMAELQSVCGLGSVTGLCGANCYHDYSAFIPGVSVRTYTDEQLAAMIAEENTPREYLGKEYTTYEALQHQRHLETVMRKYRQDIKLLQQGGAPERVIILKKARYQGKLQEYESFSNKMKLPMQKKRIFQDGLKGRFTPTVQERKALEESVINDKIKIELAEANIRGVPKLNPEKIDVSGFTFDESHINAEREHGVTRAEAERFIKEADISLTRWNGRFINYYGPHGATYVDVENKNIRTSFKKEQFDVPTLKIREVAEKYGIKQDSVSNNGNGN